MTIASIMEEHLAELDRLQRRIDQKDQEIGGLRARIFELQQAAENRQRLSEVLSQPGVREYVEEWDDDTNNGR